MRGKCVFPVASGLILMLMMFLTCGGNQTGGAIEPVTVRNESANLTAEEVQQRVKDKGFHCPGDNVKGSFRNSFEQANIRGVDVIIDHATNLMWQQAENPERLGWKEAEAYVAQMNQEEMAGFSDWRIPTAEELMSIMASKAKNDVYIDPVFKKELLSTWTADVIPEAFAGAWFVDYSEGKALDGNRAAGMGHVRLVRTSPPLTE